jgi:hypothetical protein
LSCSGNSSGTLSVIASGLTFSATDSSDTTTLTSLSDGTGLDFTYLGIGSLSIGSLNVGSGTMMLQAYLSGGDGNIGSGNLGKLLAGQQRGVIPEIVRLASCLLTKCQQLGSTLATLSNRHK